MLTVQPSDRTRCGPRRARLAVLVAAFATLPLGCSSATAAGGRTAAMPAVAIGPKPLAPSSSPDASRAAPTRAASEAELGDLERTLGDEAKLRDILRIALARNPELSEARERVRAAREAAPAASRLPAPEVEYQLWAAPLLRPYALDEAQMHMVGVRQSFPAPGSLGAQEKAASAEAEVATQSRRARELDLVARVRRAFADYYRAESEYRVRLEHVRLAQQVIDIARAAYQGGRGSQQDVLRAAVELSRLHNDIARIDGERRTARGLLNALMARSVEAPLGPPERLEPAKIQLHDAALYRIIEQRPDLAAAEGTVRAKQHELDSARASAHWPSFMVGAQYMYMQPMQEPHNYGVTVSMSVPWLNPRYGEEVRAAEARVAAERDALRSSRNTARYQVYEAAERFKAARESLAIIERDLLPQAQQSLESAQAVYRGGQADSLALFDALRSLLDIRIERERSLVRVENALTDLELAVGRPISSLSAREHRP